MNNANARAIEHAERCSREFDAAMRARDAIEVCISQEWRLAQAKASTAAVAKKNAYAHCYAIGALPKPYWA